MTAHNKARPLSAISDKELVALCVVRPCNENAWDEFILRFEQTVRWNIIHVLKVPSAEVADIAQECYIRMFEVLPLYDPSKAEVRTFLSRVFTNLTIDYMRHGAKLRSVTSSIEVELSALRVQVDGDPEMLRLATERLVNEIDDKTLATVCRALLGGKAPKEISIEAGVNLSKVYANARWFRERIHEIAATLPNT